MTFHPGSNFHIEEYLERNGMEVILPRMIHVFRKDYLSRLYEMKNLHVRYPLSQASFTCVGESGTRSRRSKQKAPRKPA